MITPIKSMTISQIVARQDDLLVSFDDVKEIAKNERTDAIDECIRLAEESCYKDIDMLISYFKELKE